MAVPSATEIQQAVEKALNWCRPTGSYILFAGKTVPDGYLLCNGAAVSRTTYAKLFAVIGTTYGAGDGSTTFNLPDLNERFLQGTSTLSSVGTKREASLPAISGSWYNKACEATNKHSGAFSSETISANRFAHNQSSYNDAAGFTFDASRSSSIYGGTSVQPPAVLALVAIRF